MTTAVGMNAMRSSVQDVSGDEGPRALVSKHGSPLLVLDCERVRAQYRRLVDALPGVGLHYAMKALPHPAVIATLNDEGSCFDVSSSGEIDVLRTSKVFAEKVIHTHPIKSDRTIRDALDFGCRRFVVDNASEMLKFVPYRDSVTLLLRVGYPSVDAAVDLSKKFGCHPDDAFALLELGQRLQLSIGGLSFHVGSQCATPRAHVGAIDRCAALIARARATGVASLRLLDLGGGFPVPYRGGSSEIEDFCAPIRVALKAIPQQVRVVAEPGRYIAAPAMTGIASVVGKARRGNAFWYYLDDGVFGSFNGRMFDPGASYPLRTVSDSVGPLQPSVLAGPTCDSIDIIEDSIVLPELNLGDLIVADMMGAYTTVCASEFNSIPRAKIVVQNCR
ncbi:MAG: type III PLP-dependent enzyme [Myxococcales bacterium]